MIPQSLHYGPTPNHLADVRAANRHASGMSTEPEQPIEPIGASQAPARRDIVYLDPRWDRPVSQYSPEGEIRMMGDFAAGLSRRGKVSRPMVYLLVAIVLLPIALSVLAVVTGW
jgi:hypothetical protein